LFLGSDIFLETFFLNRKEVQTLFFLTKPKLHIVQINVLVPEKESQSKAVPT
jgi:hypothetical protein